MRAEWSHNQCIVCLEHGDLSDEHVIPEALGGRFIAALLCRSCNSSIGHRNERAARHDPTIRLLVNELASDIPALSSSLTAGQPHIAESPGGRTKGYVKSGEFQTLSTREPDGTLIQSTSAAKRTIDRMLAKEGYDPSFRADAIRRLEEAPENIRVEVGSSLEVVKWEITGLKLHLDGPLIDPVMPIKTAYEFLALHLGSVIFGSDPPLSEVRRVLSGGQLDPKQISVERLLAERARPFHGIVFEANRPHTTIQIRLFGKLAFRVHFLCMSVQGPRFQYTHELISNKEHVSQIG